MADVVLADGGWRHDQIPAHDFGVELDGGVEIGDRQAYVGKTAWVDGGHWQNLVFDGRVVSLWHRMS